MAAFSGEFCFFIIQSGVSVKPGPVSLEFFLKSHCLHITSCKNGHWSLLLVKHGFIWWGI